MPFTLLIYRCEQDRLERLDDHLRAYRVETVTSTQAAQAALHQLRPDAFIAPITCDTLQSFTLA